MRRLIENAPALRHIAGFVEDETGATAMEYGFIASLLGVAIMLLVLNIGTEISAMFDDLGSLF